MTTSCFCNEIYDALFKTKSSICFCVKSLFSIQVFLLSFVLSPAARRTLVFCGQGLLRWKKVIISLCRSLTWSVIISKHSGTTHFAFHFRDYCLIHCFKIASAENWLWKIINKFQTVNLTNDRHTQFRGMKTPLLLGFHQLQAIFFCTFGKHAHSSSSGSGKKFPSLPMKRMKSNNNERWLHNFQVMGLLQRTTHDRSG